MNPKHLLGKLWFQIEVPNPKRADLAFEEISDLAAKELPNLLDRLLSELAPSSSREIKIDRLILNLGVLPRDNFSAVLLQKLETALLEALQTYPFPEEDKNLILPRQSRVLEFLKFYLRHGHAPWWVNQEELASSSIESLWQNLLQLDQDAAIALLQHIAVDLPMWQRFSKQLSSSSLEQSLQLLSIVPLEDRQQSPVVELIEGGKVRQDLSSAEIQQFLKAFFPTQINQLQHAIEKLLELAKFGYQVEFSALQVYEWVLPFLLKQQASKINLEVFSMLLLTKAAGHLHQSLATLQAQWDGRLTLEDVGSSSKTEIAASKQAGPTSDLLKQDQEPAFKQRLIHFLRFGNWPSGAAYDSEIIHSTLLDLLEQSAQGHVDLRQQIRTWPYLANLVGQYFYLAEILRFLERLFPARFDTIQGQIQQLLNWGTAFFPNLISTPLLYQMALPHLLKDDDASFDPEVFTLKLLSATADYLNLPFPTLSDQWFQYHAELANAKSPKPGTEPTATTPAPTAAFPDEGASALPLSGDSGRGEIHPTIGLVSPPEAQLSVWIASQGLLPAGSSEARQFENRLLDLLKTEPKKLQIALLQSFNLEFETPASEAAFEVLPPDATLNQQLLYALKFGEWPAQSTIHADAVSAELAKLLEENPELILTLLEHLNQRGILTQFLVQFFSLQVIQSILELKFPTHAALFNFLFFELEIKGNWYYPGAFSQPLLHQLALPFILRQNDQNLSIGLLGLVWAAEIAEYLSLPLEEILNRLELDLLTPSSKPIPPPESGQSEVVVATVLKPDGEMELAAASPGLTFNSKLPPNTHLLLYYLEWSRFPTGQKLSVSEMEQLFQAFLKAEPSEARTLIWALNQKVNLSFRIQQLFSTPTQQLLLQTLFPDQWPVLEIILSDLNKLSIWDSIRPLDNLMWPTVLAKLLSQKQGTFEATALVEFLITTLLKKVAPGKSPDFTLSSISPGLWASLHPVSQEIFLKSLGVLKDVDKAGIVAGAMASIERRSALSREEQAFVLLRDAWFFHLHHSQAAWWDEGVLSMEQYFQELGTLPANSVRKLSLEFLSSGYRDKWLLQLNLDNLQDILNVFWGPYAVLALKLLDLLKKIALSQGLPDPELALKTALIHRALQYNTVNTESLVTWIVQDIQRQTSWSIATWINLILERLNAPDLQVDLQLLRVKEVFSELQELGTSPPGEAINAVDTLFPEVSPTADTLQTVLPSQDSPGALVVSTDAGSIEEQIPPDYLQWVQKEINLITYFLAHGSTPASSRYISFEAFDQILQSLLSKHPELIGPILHKAFQQEELRKRGIQHFSKKSHASLAKVFWGKDYPKIEGFWIDLLVRLGKSDQERLNGYFFQYLLESAGQQSSISFEPIDFLEGLIRYIAELDQIPLFNLIQILQTPSKAMAKPDGLEAQLPELRQRIQQRILAENRQRANVENTSSPLGESILVHNAGLVLIAPYLPRYFGTLGLLDQQQFIDPASAERGVHLLQYLVSNQTETPEHLLVLNKVLCGLPLEHPLPLSFEPNEAEIDLSAQLLNSILQNWGSMKKSSIKNLQGAFLLREGLLKEGEDKWKLHVEKKAYDVLLRDLPWTFTMIKLPWMTKRMEVEWKITF